MTEATCISKCTLRYGCEKEGRKKPLTQGKFIASSSSIIIIKVMMQEA